MPKKKDSTLCTFAIPNFPRKLKARYAAWCRASDIFIKEIGRASCRERV